MSAILTALAGPLLKALFEAFGKALTDMFGQMRAEQAQRDLGASQTANKVNANTVEVQDAMANVARPSDDAVAERLRRGEF